MCIFYLLTHRLHNVVHLKKQMKSNKQIQYSAVYESTSRDHFIIPFRPNSLEKLRVFIVSNSPVPVFMCIHCFQALVAVFPVELLLLVLSILMLRDFDLISLGWGLGPVFFFFFVSCPIDYKLWPESKTSSDLPCKDQTP